jgi:hypothetical protein
MEPDPDPGGPKMRGSGVSGFEAESATLLASPVIQSSCPSLTELGKVGNPNALKTCTLMKLEIRTVVISGALHVVK